MANRGMLFFSVLVCVFFSQCTPIAYSQTSTQTRIVSDAELVEVPVIVFDDKGAPATDLTKDDFRLTEDGVEQKITALNFERVPVSFVVLADLSSSMTRKIPFVQEAALSLLDTSKEGKGKDEYSVLSIAKHAKVLLPFSGDEADIEQRLPLFMQPTNESTALFDGIWMGVDVADEDAENKTRAMIVITDGGDNHSRYSVGETKRMLEESDVPVFTIMAGASFWLPGLLEPEQPPPSRIPGLGGAGGSKQLPIPGILQLAIPNTADDYIGPAERRGPFNMKALADASGGGVFTARREEDLPRIVRTLGLALRYRYVLTYVPDRFYWASTNHPVVPDSKGMHKIHLELYPKQKFAGYSIPYYKKVYQSHE
jgi:VWFA-related protein